MENNDLEGVSANAVQRLNLASASHNLLPIISNPVQADSIASDSSGSDEEAWLSTSKRRAGMPLYGRRWIPSKRRGPLFG
jgi:hypothetical protein